MREQQPLQVALRVGRLLESLGVAYHLGGSLASSIYGEPRATNDIDLVVDLSPAQIATFVDGLGPDFSVDRESLAEAVSTRRSCNIFYLPLFTKIDLFMLGTGSFDRAEMDRRRAVTIGEPDEVLFVKSPEDTALRKLSWFRLGGEVSARQWRDVVQVLRINRGALDETLLDEWSTVLRVGDLLAKARVEAQTDGDPAR